MRATFKTFALERLKRTGGATFRLSFYHYILAVLVLSNILSAFTLVYAKDLNRRSFIQYQQLQHSYQIEQSRWSKLLLEQTTWSSQPRVQSIAVSSLGLVVPNAQQVVIVHE